MLIYRIEAKADHRCGAFSWRFGDAPASHAADEAKRVGVATPYVHPEPQNEGLPIGGDLVCGMPHLDSYRTWFAHRFVRNALYESGTHHMRVYDMPDDKVHVGMLQVTFNPDDATSVREATPEEIA